MFPHLILPVLHGYRKIDKIIKESLAAKDARLEALELKIEEQETKMIRLEALELKVQQQETLLIALQKQCPTANGASKTVLIDSQLAGRSAFPRTCREVRTANLSLSSGMYWIDPDGQDVGDDPIYVYCDMTKGI